MMNETQGGPTSGETLLPQEKEFLRLLAVRAVDAAVRRTPLPDPRLLADQEHVSLNQRLTQNRGVFVTLTAKANLRGCIGYIEGHKPLVDGVIDNGKNAAVGDPRFSPVSVPELPELDLEISVLSPLRTVNGPEDIEIGRHGILLNVQGRRSVFLPQVAIDQGWDLETTLGHLALKAGLKPNAWQEGATFQVFEAEIF